MPRSAGMRVTRRRQTKKANPGPTVSDFYRFVFTFPADTNVDVSFEAYKHWKEVTVG